jgi:hypothetical protein
MTWLTRLYHMLLCLPSFRVRMGDGTLSHNMSWDEACDYIDDTPGSAEVIVFEPLTK